MRRLPEQLLESELFGYERGAFTSAQQAKPGQIELAAGGVLFLDEVTEMSLAAQAKFLRVLQEREFQRLGATRILKANIRVIAATNRDLRKAVERGDFREDLYYRLQVFDIGIPPLRERAAIFSRSARRCCEDIGKSFSRPPAGLTREAREALLRHLWPGNVRELRNALERAAILCEGGLIRPEHLALEARASRRVPSPPISARSSARPSRRCCASAAGTGRGPPSASASRALSSIFDCRSMGSRSRLRRSSPGQHTPPLRPLTQITVSQGILCSIRAYENEPAVGISFEDLPLTHVRVGSAPAHRSHGLPNDSQWLARRYRIGFFCFFDGLPPVARHGRHPVHSLAEREAPRLYRRQVDFNDDPFLVIGSSAVCHHLLGDGLPTVQISIAARRDSLGYCSDALLCLRSCRRQHHAEPHGHDTPSADRPLGKPHCR